MATEWSTVQTICNVSYPTEVPENPTNVSNIPGFATANYSTLTTCFSGSTYSVVSGDDCNAISQKNNISTGALIVLNNLLPDCSNLDGKIHLHDTCRPIGAGYKANQSTAQLVLPSVFLRVVRPTQFSPAIPARAL